MTKVLRCEYEWEEKDQVLLCGEQVDDDSEGVWNGSEFVPVCKDCRDNPDVLFCDEYFHFEGVPCPSCAKL